MEKFEPSSIQDHQLEQLLREAFLYRDNETEETLNVNAMIQTTVFSTLHFETDTAERENEFIRKMNHAKKRRRWSLRNGIVLCVMGIALVAGYFGFRKTSSPVSPPLPVATVSPMTNPNPEPSPAEFPIVSSDNCKVVKPDDDVPIPGSSNDSVLKRDLLEDTLNLTSAAPSVPVWQELKRNTIPKLTEEDFPVLTPAEIEQNEKRKQKMLKSLIKMDKNYYCYVAPGKMTYKGKPYTMPGFYMKKTEVTNREYKTFLMDLIVQGRKEEYLKCKVDGSGWTKIGLPSYAVNYFYDKKFDEHPVVNISREGAKLFCKWLTDEVATAILSSGKHINDDGSVYIPDVFIPAETQWAFAAKAQNDSALYADGLNALENLKGCELANYKLITGNSPHRVMNKKRTKLDESHSKYMASDSTVLIPGKYKYCGDIDSALYYTVPVFSFNPNNYGIYCMAGNVAEMVYAPDNMPARTMGGSWNSTRTHLLIEGKDDYEGISGPSPFIGFRPIVTYLVKK